MTVRSVRLLGHCLYGIAESASGSTSCLLYLEPETLRLINSLQFFSSQVRSLWAVTISNMSHTAASCCCEGAGGRSCGVTVCTCELGILTRKKSFYCLKHAHKPQHTSYTICGLPVPGPRGDRAHCHMTQESDCQKSQTIRVLPLWHSRVCFWLIILFVVFGV